MGMTERTHHQAGAGVPAEKNYLDWANAGGPNECKHGYAKGITCLDCEADRMERSVIGTCFGCGRPCSIGGDYCVECYSGEVNMVRQIIVTLREGTGTSEISKIRGMLIVLPEVTRTEYRDEPQQATIHTQSERIAELEQDRDNWIERAVARQQALYEALGRIAEWERAAKEAKTQAPEIHALIAKHQQRIAELEMKAQGLQNAGEYLAGELDLTRRAAMLVGNMGTEDLDNGIRKLRDEYPAASSVSLDVTGKPMRDPDDQMEYLGG